MHTLPDRKNRNNTGVNKLPITVKSIYSRKVCRVWKLAFNYVINTWNLKRKNTFQSQTRAWKTVLQMGLQGQWLTLSGSLHLPSGAFFVQFNSAINLLIVIIYHNILLENTEGIHRVFTGIGGSATKSQLLLVLFL